METQKISDQMKKLVDKRIAMVKFKKQRLEARTEKVIKGTKKYQQHKREIQEIYQKILYQKYTQSEQQMVEMIKAVSMFENLQILDKIRKGQQVKQNELRECYTDWQIHCLVEPPAKKRMTLSILCYLSIFLLPRNWVQIIKRKVVLEPNIQIEFKYLINSVKKEQKNYNVLPRQQFQ
ncbi:Hypothetical_protein [Hexamita inflata]|uniref:Hypothetical_protein n=1 Tax=Hexamita inflata TaxID=28002 RepID=A0AA86QTM1_9EUKA|nr:Hypothetical protein HINF_LOCUS51493 [Hexamita inflata]